jgi:hypothetical protein
MLSSSVRKRAKGTSMEPGENDTNDHSNQTDPSTCASSCKPAAGRVYNSTRSLLRKKEIHITTFNNEKERWNIVMGYIVIMGCNLLSCLSLLMYMTSQISASTELRCEFFFLLFKGACEMYQGKFSWALLLHHSAMILGFWFNMHSSLQCFSWIVVHQQYVHFPFALRALWRLTLPSLGYIENEMSWRRRGVSNFFWMSWMFVVGYRTPLITFYGLYAAYSVNDQNNVPMVWQGLLTFGFGMIILNLDRQWTIAMWPKKAKPTMLHQFYFNIGARFMFAAGVLCATLIMFAQDLDIRHPWYSEQLLVPSWARFRLTGIDNLTTLECLKNNNFKLDNRPNKISRFTEFLTDLFGF